MKLFGLVGKTVAAVFCLVLLAGALPAAEIKTWKNAGIQYLAHSTDYGIYRAACADLCALCKKS